MLATTCPNSVRVTRPQLRRVASRRSWHARPARRRAGQKLASGFFRSAPRVRTWSRCSQLADSHQSNRLHGYESVSGCTVAANSGMNPLQRQVQAMIDSGVLPSLAADAGAGALGPKKVTVEGLRTVITNSLKQMDELFTKNRYGFYSIDAVNLLLGTAIQESGGLRWRVQVNGGPTRGLFQMEEATYTDIWNNFLQYRPQLADALRVIFTPAGGSLIFDRITIDDGYAAAMARLKYFRVPNTIPGTLDGQAHYWKQYYNTPQGKGTVQDYIENWNTYVSGP